MVQSNVICFVLFFKDDALWNKKEERQLWNIIIKMLQSDLKDISMVPDIFL